METTFKSKQTGRAGATNARRIEDLKQEQARLEEEVLQLKAAVNVWEEVCRHKVELAMGSLTSAVEIRRHYAQL